MSKNMKQILFVCAGNVCRSPTAEKRAREWLTKWGVTNINVSSAGIYHSSGYGVQLTEKAVRDADLIFCMDLSQEIFFAKRFSTEMRKVHTIGISDQYDPESEELLELLDYWFNSKFGRLIHG
jgi:protein-tyrosine-phosphatase